MTRRLWGPWLLVLAALSVGHLLLWGRVDLTPTINLIKLEWTISATIGASYSGWFLFDCLGDRRSMLESGRNGANRDAAEILILLAVVLLGVHLLFWVLGILSMLTPSGGRTTQLGIVTGVSFTAVGQFLVLLLVRVQVLRGRIRDFNYAAGPAKLPS